MASTSEPDSSAVLNQPPVQLVRRQQLERLLRTNPTNLEAFEELASIYRHENRPVEARRILAQALEVFPDNVDLLYQYEESVLARSWQQFREVSDLATRLQTREADRELARATHDWAMRRIDVCRARLDREAAPPQLHVQLGEALFDAEEYDEAIAEVMNVHGRDDCAPSADMLIARCHLARGNDLEACKSLRRCAMRRAVVAPPTVRVTALRLLCDIAARLNLEETHRIYQMKLAEAEKTLATSRASSQLPPAQGHSATDSVGNAS